MAKKKTKKATGKDYSSAAANMESTIIKEFGEVLRVASELKESPPKIIPTTPQMDVILGGGVPEGSFVVITGPPGLGKSAISLQLAANAQKIDSEFGPRKVYYFDIEGRIKKRDLFSNPDLDTSPDRFQLIKSSLDKIIIGEEFIDIGERLIKHVPGSVFIFDSFSALCTKARHEANLGDRFRDDTPLLLASFVKRINQIIPVNKSIVIAITHLLANQGMGMSMWTEASGQKIQYQADVKIRGKYTKAWLVSNEQVGQDVFWECQKSALTGPGGKATCKLRYNHGFDEYAEMVDLASDLSIIKKGGAWYSLGDNPKDLKNIPENERSDYEFVTCQGQEKFVNYLKENRDVYDKIRNTIFTDYFPVGEV